jgi:hypothetical protein
MDRTTRAPSTAQSALGSYAALLAALSRERSPSCGQDSEIGPLRLDRAFADYAGPTATASIKTEFVAVTTSPHAQR